MEEPPSAMSGVQHAVELTLLRTDMGLTKALGPADIGSSPCGRIERRESEPGYTFQWFISYAVMLDIITSAGLHAKRTNNARTSRWLVPARSTNVHLLNLWLSR